MVDFPLPKRRPGFDQCMVSANVGRIWRYLCHGILWKRHMFWTCQWWPTPRLGEFPAGIIVNLGWHAVLHFTFWSMFSFHLTFFIATLVTSLYQTSGSSAKLYMIITICRKPVNSSGWQKCILPDIPQLVFVVCKFMYHGKKMKSNEFNYLKANRGEDYLAVWEDSDG